MDHVRHFVADCGLFADWEVGQVIDAFAVFHGICVEDVRNEPHWANLWHGRWVEDYCSQTEAKFTAEQAQLWLHPVVVSVHRTVEKNGHKFGGTGSQYSS